MALTALSAIGVNNEALVVHLASVLSSVLGARNLHPSCQAQIASFRQNIPNSPTSFWKISQHHNPSTLASKICYRDGKDGLSGFLSPFAEAPLLFVQKPERIRLPRTQQPDDQKLVPATLDRW